MQKIQINVADLKKGMYVSELDRPWNETRFLFQGFRITNDQELLQLRDTCEYVYVDAGKSAIDIVPDLISLGKTTARAKPPAPKKTQLLKPADPPCQVSFEKEFPQAKRIYLEALENIRQIFHDVRLARAVAHQEVRETVRVITESILRHPDALKLMASFKEKSDHAVSHALHVCILTLAFGRYLGLTQSKLEELGMGALLHDVGELSLPEEILQKAAGQYSEDELEEMKLHTTYGVEILNNSKNIPNIVFEIVRDHHERMNCTGYPRRLCGTDINYMTMIVSIADVYDAVTMGLENKPRISSTDALKSMYDWRETLFDGDLIEHFIQCLGIYPVGSVVELNSEEIGIVVNFTEKKRLSPRVMLVKDPKHQLYTPPRLIDLSQYNHDDTRYEIRRVVNPDEYQIDVRQYILRELHVEQMLNA